MMRQNIYQMMQQYLQKQYTIQISSSSSFSDLSENGSDEMIMIHFIFENKDGIEFNYNVNLDTKIESLIKYLKDVYDLSGKVEIAYKDMKTNKTVVLDYNKQVIDYVDKMKLYGENILYIKTENEKPKPHYTPTYKKEPAPTPTPKPPHTPEHKEKSAPKPTPAPAPAPLHAPEHKEEPMEKKKPTPVPPPSPTELPVETVEPDIKLERKKKVTVSKFTPQITKADEEEEKEIHPLVKKKKEPKQPELSKYQFKFEDDDKKILLEDNSNLADNEDKIKEKFGIDDDDEIEYFIIDADDDDDDDENPIKKPDKKLMKKFKNKTILIKKVKDESTNRINFIDDEDESNHKILKRIGEGATSITYKIIDKRTNKIMCKKVLKLVEADKICKKVRNSMKEIEVLHHINHPCICRAIGINLQEQVNELNSSDSKSTTTIALFLEYLPVKLSNFLKSDKINNTLKVKIAIEVAFGMLHLHELGMIHRDLKVDNIMLDDNFKSKIIDFDLVRIEDDSDKSLTKGIVTLDYMSPEMLNKQNYDNKTDVYSYGIVLYVIFTGNLPKQNITDKMNKKQIEFIDNESLTKECKDLIIKCTSFEPSSRPSFKKIIDYIKSKSFKPAKGININILDKRYQELNRFQIKFQSAQNK